MMQAGISGVVTKNTSAKLVLPFYVYGAIAFLIACTLLFTSSNAFLEHHFHPQTLAITHIMALGWGTMIILGASHQLVPVLIEGKIYSEILGYLSFAFLAVGIPLLALAFYLFRFDWMAQAGGISVCVGIFVFLVNLALSMAGARNENVHALFIFMATLWLLITAVIGVFLVLNFTSNLLAYDSLHYLPLHAHLGIAGWFLLLVFGVASRLIPMFLISKYENKRLLKLVFWLINGGLILFVVLFQTTTQAYPMLVPVFLVLAAVGLFGKYCLLAYKNRLRKKVDEQLRLSLLSVAMILIPLVLLVILLTVITVFSQATSILIVYGFCIFFGWITAIILGMSFKTLPFILWKERFSAQAGKGKTPGPKDLFSDSLFRLMAGFYFAGFILFCSGVLFKAVWLIQVASAALILCALLYNTNLFKMFFSKPRVK